MSDIDAASDKSGVALEKTATHGRVSIRAYASVEAAPFVEEIIVLKTDADYVLLYVNLTDAGKRMDIIGHHRYGPNDIWMFLEDNGEICVSGLPFEDCVAVSETCKHEIYISLIRREYVTTGKKVWL